jgi:hypothetical protein
MRQTKGNEGDKVFEFPSRSWAFLKKPSFSWLSFVKNLQKDQTKGNEGNEVLLRKNPWQFLP